MRVNTFARTISRTDQEDPFGNVVGGATGDLVGDLGHGGGRVCATLHRSRNVAGTRGFRTDSNLMWQVSPKREGQLRP